MPSKPLHQRLRDLLPERIEQRIPSALKPPAWRKPPDWSPMPAPDWALDENRELRWVWGDPAEVRPPAGESFVYATEDSKGKLLAEPLRIEAGERGRMVGVGPDFVVVQFGHDYPAEGMVATRVRLPKSVVVNLKPVGERKIGRTIEVSLRDLQR